MPALLIWWSLYLALCSYSTVWLNHDKIEMSVNAKIVSLLFCYIYYLYFSLARFYFFSWKLVTESFNLFSEASFVCSKLL